MHDTPALARFRRLRGVASLAVLGLLCRALIPAGFMPAAIGAGGPVAVCHGGLAGEFFLRLEAARSAATAVSAGGHLSHASHDAHDVPADADAPDGQLPAEAHEGWEHCPFGAAFGAALLAADVAVELPSPGHELRFVEPPALVSYRPVSSYHARAPPSAAIHS